MSDIDPDFLRELQDAFALEAADQLQAIMSSLIQLESAGSDDEKIQLVEEILHNLHSMKGNGRAAGFVAVESLCQEFESALLSLKRRGQLLYPEAADVMHRAVDVLDSLIGGAGAESTDFLSVLQQLEELDERRKDLLEAPLAEALTQAVNAMQSDGTSVMNIGGLPAPHGSPSPDAEALAAALGATMAGAGASAPLQPLPPAGSPTTAAGSPAGAASFFSSPPPGAGSYPSTGMPAPLNPALSESSGATRLVDANLTARPPGTNPPSDSPVASSPRPSGTGGAIPPAVSPPPAPQPITPATRRASDGVASTAKKTAGAPERSIGAPGERSASVRMPLWKLDRLLREAEEMLVVKQIAEQHVEDSGDMRLFAKRLSAECRRFSDTVKHKNFRGNLDATQDVTAFASWLSQFASSMETRVVHNLRRQQQQQRVCGNLVDGFLDSVKSLLMQDFSGLLSVIPKVVRDLSRELDKEVELEIFGSDIEIDRRILEEIKDPLIHLIRNSLDHGIEPPAARVVAGKRAAALLRVGAVQTGDGQVELLICDDGRGINLTKVKEAAVREQVLTGLQAEKLSRTEVLDLIYRSAISTSEKVTEISGRGLGMAIVRERIHDLGGRIILETEEGLGTTFRLQLPIKLSTFRGIHVIAGGLSFIVPTLNVHHAGRVRLSEIGNSGSKNVIKADGQLVAVQFLTDVLKISSSADRTRELHQLLVIGTNSERTGFLVDEILQEHEVLVRPFTAPLLRVPNFSGATVLGSGSVLPVVNMADLMKTSTKAKWADEALAALLTERAVRLDRLARSPVYIIDRATTSRVMVKTLLEGEGYKVKTFENVELATEQDGSEKPILVLKSAQANLDLRVELDDVYLLERAFDSAPVLLFGTQPEERCLEFALSAGARGYINTLEFDREVVIKLVRTVI